MVIVSKHKTIFTNNKFLFTFFDKLPHKKFPINAQNGIIPSNKAYSKEYVSKKVAKLKNKLF